MKTFYLLHLLSLPLFCFSQERQTFMLDYLAIYDMTFTRDSLSQQETELTAYLSFNDSISVFRSELRYRDDSVKYQHLYGKTKPSGSTISLVGQSREDNLILKHKDTIRTFEHIRMGANDVISYFHEESKQSQNWMLMDDILTISGYLCQKATLQYGNRHWTAWFTYDIPISDGPYRFAGLPGLIIKMEDKTHSWKFELVRLLKKPHDVHINFDKSVKYKKINKKEFYKQKKYLLDNIVDIRAAASIKADPSMSVRLENYRNQIKAVRATDNNWIELYP